MAIKHHLILAAAVALASTSFSTRAFAQDDAPAASPADKKKEAGKRFKRGTEFYQEGNHQAALIELRRAYELAPNWRVLFNIGQVQYQLQDYPAAIESFERYLAEGDTQIPKARRRVVDSDLKKLRARVATLTVEVDTSGAEVRIDNKLVGQSPMPALTVGAGRRELKVTKANHKPYTQTLEIAGGDNTTVKVQLLPIQAAPAPTPSPAPITMPSPRKPAADTRSESQVPWAAWGLTGGFAAGAVVFGALALDSKNGLDEKKAGQTTADELNKQADRTLALAITTDVLLGAAAVTGIIATVLTITADDQPNDNAGALRPQLDFAVGPTSVTLYGTF